VEEAAVIRARIISTRQPEQWEQLADIPDEEFEAAFNTGNKPSTRFAFRRRPSSPMRPGAVAGVGPSRLHRLAGVPPTFPRPRDSQTR